MKYLKLSFTLFLILAIQPSSGFAQTTIQDIICTPKPMYGYRADGTPGRELHIRFIGDKLIGNALVEIRVGEKKETTQLTPVETKGYTSRIILLPAGVGVDKETNVVVTFIQGKKKLVKTVIVPPMRHWTLFLYNHSHVDIGYTNTQENVEILHKTNVLEGIQLAKETQHFPKGSRFKWNPEVTWPVERLWNSHPDERPNILQAIKEDQLCIDASYLNLNTSICADEELFQIFRFSRKLQKLTGKPMDVFQQFDIPGITWGLIPVMKQEGIKYIISWINATDRVGNAHRYGINQFPFWWVGPDGESKVLFFQPGNYANSGSMVKGGETGRPWFGQRDPSKVPAVIKTGKANVDFTAKLIELEEEKYPYDFQVFSWTLWDNSPLDADVPYAVNKWNEKYAYPKIIIAGGHEIMSYIDEKHGDRLPVVMGDYTEYWTDGAGTAAGLTAMNRNAKERLIQAEKLWSMLNTHRSIPRVELDEAWRSIAMGSEHTWCFEDPSDPYFQDAIFEVKQSYFHDADARSREMLEKSLSSVTNLSNNGIKRTEISSEGGIAVFNTNSWQHNGLITLNNAESMLGDRVVDEKGNEVPAQRLSTGELVFMASDVPALGSRYYRITEGESFFTEGCTIQDNTLENGLLKVVVNKKNGNITELVDMKTGYNYADEKVNGGLNAFRWLPGNINAPVADSVIQITTTENGPLVVELSVQSQGKGVRSVNRNVRLIAGQPYIEISNVVDKLPLIEKDGIHFGFGFNIPRSRTRVDIPWGVMEVEKDQWKQANRNWMAVQRWLDMSNDNRGITWCSLDAPLFQYGSMSANNAHGWGNKGPWIESLEPSSTIYSWVMNNHWHTNFPLTQDGPVCFRYRIMMHEGYDAAAANRFGLEQTHPLVHVTTSKDPRITPFVKIDNQNIVLSILKSTKDKKVFILRLRSLSDKIETVTLDFSHNPQSVHLCNLEEEPAVTITGPIEMQPFGITTIRVEL